MKVKFLVPEIDRNRFSESLKYRMDWFKKSSKDLTNIGSESYTEQNIYKYKVVSKRVISKNDLSLLSLFNHSGFSLKKSSFSGNWIHIPFEFSFYSFKKSEECLGSGFVNLLLKDSSVSNCVVKFCFPEKSYKFCLKFENERCNSVLIENLEKSFSLEKLKAFLKRLPFFSENFSVSVCEKDFFSDFEAESFDIFKLNERI